MRDIKITINNDCYMSSYEKFIGIVQLVKI